MELAQIAESQSGVFTRLQARRCGHSWKQIRGKLDRGEWVSVASKALAVAGTPITTPAQEWAALLTAGTLAVLSGPSAAAQHGWDIPGPRPCITIPPSQRLTMPGVVVIRSDLPDGDIDVRDCVAVTSGIRTILDCLRLLPFDDAARVLDRALQKQLVDFDGLCSRITGLAGRRGTPKLVKLVKQASLGTRSEAERRLRTLLRRARIGGWKANLRVSDAAGWIGEVDIAFPDLKLAIEVDGRAWHASWDRFEWDRAKQNRLELAGWKVLRFTWEQITRRPAKVIADIRQMLAVLGGGQ